MSNGGTRLRTLVGGAIAVGALTCASPASATVEGTSPCIASLASSDPGIMASTVKDWQDDFLDLDQNAGHYAVTIARARAPFCPGPG